MTFGGENCISKKKIENDKDQKFNNGIPYYIMTGFIIPPFVKRHEIASDKTCTIRHKNGGGE